MNLISVIPVKARPSNWVTHDVQSEYYVVPTVKESEIITAGSMSRVPSFHIGVCVERNVPHKTTTPTVCTVSNVFH